MKTATIAMMLLMLGCSGPATAPDVKPVTIEFGGGRTVAEPVDDCRDAIEFRNWVKKANYPLWLQWHGGTATDTVGGE